MSGGENGKIWFLCFIKIFLVKNNNEPNSKTKYEKRRNTPRLPIVYTTTEIMQKLDYLAGIHGSKKAAIEAAICALYCAEEQK